MKLIDDFALEGMDLKQPGLEIAPLYRPVASKKTSNVHYTDYTTKEDLISKHEHYEHAKIVDLDYVWAPGRALKNCAPSGVKYKWAIASHVMEHVPDPIGWILEVFEMMEVGGTFSLVLPDKNSCFDRNRRTTQTSDLLHSWLNKDKRPNTKHLYDFLSNVTTEVKYGGDIGPNHYSRKESLDFVINSFTTGQYFDAHCSVFTCESFQSVFSELNEIGVINVSISTPRQIDDGIYVKLMKNGDPSVARPNGIDDYSALQERNNHLEKAYSEAIEAQERLKEELIKSKQKTQPWWKRFF